MDSVLVLRRRTNAAMRKTGPVRLLVNSHNRFDRTREQAVDGCRYLANERVEVSFSASMFDSQSAADRQQRVNERLAWSLNGAEITNEEYSVNASSFLKERHSTRRLTTR